MEDIRERLVTMALDQDEYFYAITDAVAEGIAGGRSTTH